MYADHRRLISRGGDGHQQNGPHSAVRADGRNSDRRYDLKQLGWDKYNENGKLKRDINNETHLIIDTIVNISRQATRLLQPAKPL